MIRKHLKMLLSSLLFSFPHNEQDNFRQKIAVHTNLSFVIKKDEIQVLFSWMKVRMTHFLLVRSRSVSRLVLSVL